MSITLDSVEKSFGDEHVLSDVELSVDDGEFCIIIGPSGCGKTTLLNCVAGLVRPDAGDVRRDGESLLDTPINERDFGIVFQDFEERLFPHMTVAENVAFGLKQTGDFDDETVEERIDEVLDLLAISQTRDDYPPNLSGGQQQRVELARQLVRESETLLLDDPLSDLDYKLQKQLELELRRLQDAEGDTILYVTHNQDQSLKLADQIVVMNRGTIEQVAPPADVYHNPETAFVARFIGDSNLLVVDSATVENGATMLETDVGLFSTDSSDESVADDGVAIVRPEDVHFGNGENSLTGVLEQRIYTGETTEFVISVGDVIEEFRVQNPGEVSLESLDATIGDEVTVSWSREDLHYFEPGELSVTGELTVGDLEAV
jgi:ABC-type Fe3+/spermidine/putrescine transport system ATPase subunit